MKVSLPNSMFLINELCDAASALSSEESAEESFEDIDVLRERFKLAKQKMTDYLVYIQNCVDK